MTATGATRMCEIRKPWLKSVYCIIFTFFMGNSGGTVHVMSVSESGHAPRLIMYITLVQTIDIKRTYI